MPRPLGLAGPLLVALLVTACASVEEAESPTLWPPPVEMGELPKDRALVPEEAAGPTDETAEREQKSEWVLAPVPFYNPTLEAGLGVAAAYIFPWDSEDEDSPPSSAGGGGFYSSNDSWLIGGGLRAHLDHDTWRLLVGGAYGQINLDFYGIGSEAGDRGKSIDLEQVMYGARAEVLRGLGKGVFLGPRVTYGYVESTFYLGKNVDLPEGFPDRVSVDSQLVAVGLRAEWDLRDSQFYPTEGHHLDLIVDVHSEALGDDNDFEVFELAYDHFFGLDEASVLAVRGYSRFTTGDVPYYSLSLFGRGADLRGYQTGQYRDRVLLAGQAEYRRRVWKKLGVVGFAGIGEVADHVGEMNMDDVLSSVGVGLRYLLAEENQINFRFDAAYGKEGWAFYFAVGEAF